METTSQIDSDVLMIGLSGPTSAGKTTLSHLLRHVIPSITLILHFDLTFARISKTYLPSMAILTATDPRALRMVQTLDYIKTNSGKTPPDFGSRQADVFPGQEERALNMVPPTKADGAMREGQKGPARHWVLRSL